MQKVDKYYTEMHNGKTFVYDKQGNFTRCVGRLKKDQTLEQWVESYYKSIRV